MSINSSSLSLPGLSGYDFSGIVEKLVETYRLPENSMNDKQNALQVRKDAWRDVNTRLKALDDKITALKNASVWTATTVSSTDANVVAATSTSSASTGTYSISVTNIAQFEIDVSKETSDSTLESDMSANPYTNPTSTTSSWDFQINGKTVFVKRSASSGSPTLIDIQNAINNASAGVKASVIQVRTGVYRLSITADKIGQANQITFADPNNFLRDGLGISLDASGHVSTQASGSAGGYTQQAKDANFTVNGIAITSSTNTVTSAIQGVTLTLKSSGNSTLNVSSDPSVAVKAVQDFVDQYNSVMSFIADKLKYDADTKKTGDLFGDPMLQSIQSRLRSLVGGTFNNPTTPYTILKDIGISTSSENYGKDATLTFDTAKFGEALAANAQSVANLFGAPYDGVTPANDAGVSNLIHNYLYPQITYGGTIERAQNSLGEQIKDIEDRINDFEDRVAAYEARMKAKFAALESLLSNYNAQASWLNAQLNTLTIKTK